MSSSGNARRSRACYLAAWLGALLHSAAVLAGSAPAPASTEALQTDTSASSELEAVTVTGSLIPQDQTILPEPLTVITNEDMQLRGFSTVAEALQQSIFATGSIDGPQATDGFTPGAQTLSMFGLSPSYVKYLIDGRPMSDYPSLYEGNNVIVSLTGIPQALIDHVDVLPGGQSSLYGSDAIAGVINIVLKKQLDAPIVDLRYGFYQDGGGIDRRIALADSFNFGAVTLLVGGQYENTDPIWGYQRPLTSSYYTTGSTPVTGEQDWEVFNYNGSPFYFLDPSNCVNVASQFGGTTRKYTLPGSGSYCGTTNAGYYTLNNGAESGQGYLRATADVREHLQLYVDVLYSHDVESLGDTVGGWGTFITYGGYYDPNLGALVNLFRLFSPEEAGGLTRNEDRIFSDTYRATLGAQGSLGGSKWTYDVSMTHDEYRLIRRNAVQFANLVDRFYSTILGPDLGVDPIYGAFPVFKPNYAAFYQPLTPAQYASFSGYASVREQTWDNLFQAQLTSTSLFKLPGGDAALAWLLEAADQGWGIEPDEAYENGSIYEYVATQESGLRSRQATTAELRMPLTRVVSASASGRLDTYRVSGANISHGTYTLALGVQPQASLLLRARYGTAFKAPTLADEYQGRGGGYTGLTDYYTCAQQGYSDNNIGNCPEYSAEHQVITNGNTGLEPITATVWDAGVVWTPFTKLSLSSDFLQWAIHNEVSPEDADQILKTEALCRLGSLNIQSPTCVAALAQVMRDPATGVLESVYIPKINVSHEALNVAIANLTYDIAVGRLGNLAVQSSWSDLLKHTYQQYPYDPVLNYITNPEWNTDFKSKLDGSISWSVSGWTSTIFLVRYGRTPNYLATNNGYGTPGAGTLAPWIVGNASVQYQWRKPIRLSFTVDNVMNAMPPADHSYPGSVDAPYNIGNYNPYGRSFYLQLTYKFEAP